jgi:hypothetical protein
MCVQWTTNLPATVKSSLLKRYHALLKEDFEIERALGKCCQCGNVANTNVANGQSADVKTMSNKLEIGTGNTGNIGNNKTISDEYFRLVGFQARFLAYAGIIHLEGRGKDYARSVIDPLYERWDKLDGGKWSGFWCDTIDERGGKRQPTNHNRWSSQMQWAWNEPADPYAAKDRGVARVNYPATAYRADVEEPIWLEPTTNVATNGGAWTRVPGLGTSGNALALLPVKPGVGKGAMVEYALMECCHCGNVANANVANGQVELEIGNTGNIGNTLILQFLPDFALWPGLKLGVKVSFDDGVAQYVAVPKSDSNIGEHDRIRNQAVQDNFIRVEVPIPLGAKRVRIRAVDPGVVMDKVGVSSSPATAIPL